MNFCPEFIYSIVHFLKPPFNIFFLLSILKRQNYILNSSLKEGIFCLEKKKPQGGLTTSYNHWLVVLSGRGKLVLFDEYVMPTSGDVPGGTFQQAKPCLPQSGMCDLKDKQFYVFSITQENLQI